MMFEKLGKFVFDDTETEAIIKNLGQELEWRDSQIFYTLSNGVTISYRGQWVVNSNIRQGRGVLNVSNGEQNEGYFVNNLQVGKGRCITPAGVVYEGQWKDGKQHGEGK